MILYIVLYVYIQARILASSYSSYFFVDLPAIFFALSSGFFGRPTIDDSFHLAALLSVRTEIDFPGPKFRAYGCQCTAFYTERTHGWRKGCPGLLNPGREWRWFLHSTLELLDARRSLLRDGPEEATALSSPGRASFRSRGPSREHASEHCTMATRLIGEAIFLIPMYPGAFAKPIDGTHKTS